MTSVSDNPDLGHSSMRAGTVLQDRYRIVRQLGRGGMGAVYEALDQRLGITVALKETLSSEPSMRKQFEHEARLLAGMQHPALPRVSDHFVEGDRAFLVMQFIGGVDLAKIISRQPGPFPREQVIAWADQLLDALIYLHSRDRQVIHRDIKPHNLKLTSSGQIALLDFGLAKAQPADTSLTASRAFFGYTKHYAPLEQIQDLRTDQRSDIYALGATLYHLLTGAKPPDALVRATALINSEADPLKPANEIHPSVGEEVSAILNKAMAQKSEDRYGTAGEFREALRRLGREPEKKEAKASIEGKGSNATPRGTGDIFKTEDSQFSEVDYKSGRDINMAMVASAKRFGPGAFTAGLVVLIGIAVGILNASPDWLKWVTRANASSASSALEEAAAPSRKLDRARTLNSTGNNSGPTKTKTQREKVAEQRAVDKKESLSERSGSDVKGRGATKSGESQRKHPVAPSIRFPSPEVADNAVSLNPNTRSYGHTLNAAPQFFRSADGTFTVKFSDGTTRVIRPGETAAR